MLHRVTDREDRLLPRVIRLRALLEARPLTGAGLPSVTIGRSELNDVCLGCSGFPVVMSRRHASVSFDGEVYRLADEDACNGTYVNETTLPRNGSRALRVGDVVSFGGAASFLREGIILQNPFRFVFVDDAEPAESGAEAGAEAGAPQRVPPAPAPPAPPAPAAQQAAPAPAAPAPGAIGEAASASERTRLSGRRRAREEDAAAQPPATRRRTAAAAAAAAAQASRLEAAEARRVAAAADAARRAALLAAVQAESAAAAARAAKRKPLPTFEPMTVAPLPTDSVAALVGGMAAESSCSICYELLVAPHALACSHVFCGECVTRALQLRPSNCPECRARPGKPVYVRRLDALLCAAVEPTLDEAAAAERLRRKRVWQEMQVATAVAARDAPPRPSRAPSPPPRRNNGFMHGPPAPAPVPGVLGRMDDVIVIDSDAEAAAAAADASAWHVGYAPAGGARLVCHGCFQAVPPGGVRVVHEAPPPQGPFAQPQPPRSRAFFHPACRPAACPGAHALRGMDALQPAERDAVAAALATPQQDAQQPPAAAAQP